MFDLRSALDQVNDGSTLSNLQVVVNSGAEGYDTIESGLVTSGASVAVEGELVACQGSKQKVELNAEKVTLIGGSDATTFPVQKKKLGREYLRTIVHMQPRTNTFGAVARVRNALAYATHQFFQEKGFVWVASPIITASDCEGAGEQFCVTTLIPNSTLNPSTKVSEIPSTKDGQLDWSQVSRVSRGAGWSHGGIPAPPWQLWVATTKHCRQLQSKAKVTESQLVAKDLKQGTELRPEIRELAEKLMAGSERALSRAITLCESGLASDRAQAASLLQHVLLAMESMEHKPIFRFGLTGPPGCGKSSLIEVVGKCATRAGEKVAVLAIDPSSERTGGSILGDKTRMESLSQDPNAFVRPTPAQGHLGGMARNTADAALLCEAGGYTVLIIETVGGGQSDIAVAELADCVILVLPPAGGDELQGIKKGVVEVADIVLVNKADGDMEKAAKRAVMEYKSALHFAGSRSVAWSPPVLSCSARTGKGIDKVWAKICEFERVMTTSGELQSRRALQIRQLLWSNIKNEITERLRTDESLGAIMVDLEEQVMVGKLASRSVAYHVANKFLVRQS